MNSSADSPAFAGSHAGAALRVIVFLMVAYAVQLISFSFLQIFGLFVAATLGVFAGGAVATALAMRIYGAGLLADIGLAWHRAARRHLALGVLLGGGAATVVVAIPLLLGKARFVPSSEYPFSPGGMLLVGVLLLFGALGEELIFRGYPFQMLAGRYGKFTVLVPASASFAFAHGANPGSSPLALLNTFAWGLVLGYALLRSGDLWLPTALHFGWNFTLPLFGVNLSGFRMGMTGRSLEWLAGPEWSGGAYGPEASVLTSIAAVTLLIALHRIPLDRQPLSLLPEFRLEHGREETDVEPE